MNSAMSVMLNVVRSVHHYGPTIEMPLLPLLPLLPPLLEPVVLMMLVPALLWIDPPTNP
jgi:hypothetical protein